MSTEILRPNGVGSETSIHSQYPDSDEHWDKVDEVVADDAGSYIFMTVGQDVGVYKRDLYALPAHKGSGTINKITVYFRINVNASAGKASIRTHGTSYDGSAHGVTTWTTYSEEWTTNPNTGNPWTWAEIDALEAGVSLRGTNYRAQCTQVYVEVDYTGAKVSMPSEAASSATKAILNGFLDDDGGEACDCGFEWGETIAYGNTTPTQSRITGQTFSQQIEGLTPGTTYHYRALATNSLGTSHSDDRTFVAENKEILRPNAAGDLCTISFERGEACPNHYLNVDEEEADDDTSYVYGEATGGTFPYPNRGDLYNIKNHSIGSGVITGVKIRGRFCRDNGSPRPWSCTTPQACICFQIKTGGSVYFSPAWGISTGWGEWFNKEYTWTTNPKTGVAWTWDDIDALQIGIQTRRPCYAGVRIYSECTQVYVEVSFMPAKGMAGLNPALVENIIGV